MVGHWHQCYATLSTHDLTRRSTALGSVRAFELVLSTHDLTRRSTMPQRSEITTTIFQLTTSHGGRPFSRSMPASSASFNSRPHTEVDNEFGSFYSMILTFQLTTSHGGRLLLQDNYFSSDFLSTHDLTRRSTIHNIRNVIYADLSTHDLTRRSTNGFHYRIW